jgi:YidC/Oxa1 family membrane protein insertase
MLRVVASSSNKLLSSHGARQKCTRRSNIRSCAVVSPSSNSSRFINPLFSDASRNREYHHEPPNNNNCNQQSKMIWKMSHQQHGLNSMSSSRKEMRGLWSSPPFASNRPNFHHSNQRWFSSAGSAGSDNNDTPQPTDEFAASSSSSSSVDDTLERLFAENQQQDLQIADALTTAMANWEPTWYNVADQAVVAVKAFHDLMGIEYGWSIVGVTILIRLGLFPLMIQSQRTSSRMAHIQPELNQMKDRYEAIGTPSRQEQVQFATKIKALFARYEVKPSRAFIAPVMQIPLFMGMFFGLRKMPNIYPDELATGGMFWFENLNNPDPLYILPVLSGLTFFAVIELGKNDMAATMSPQQGQIIVNVFRFMSLGMMYVR